MVSLEKIEKEDLVDLPYGLFPGTIKLVDNAFVARAVFKEIESTCKVVGFDTETRPNFQRGKMHRVSLLQICDGERAWLIRLTVIGLIPEIQSFFANPDIMKVGLSISDDIRALRGRGEIEPVNVVDVQDVVKSMNIPDISLAKLAARTLGIRISKRQRVTNWAASSLSVAQQNYAATDAWVTLRIYEELQKGVVMIPQLQEIVKRRLANQAEEQAEQNNE
ncbi:MAG: 3'-5' exonuclease domain-containing protein 2 [Bacteroidales bacterium]|nr:3'-5' exonuclease domain-containing protein 2 [Bacteroidales bacterium]